MAVPRSPSCVSTLHDSAWARRPEPLPSPPRFRAEQLKEKARRMMTGLLCMTTPRARR